MTPQELALMRERELSKQIISNLLAANKDKNFVQRILEPSKYPTIANKDGSFSTHLMASAEVDGKNIAFPTIFFDEKKKSLYVPKDPVAEALKTKQFIEFKSPKEANWFSTNYKLAMPQK